MDDQSIAEIIDEIDGTKDGQPTVPEELSLLPLRDWVIFPVIVTPLGVGRESSIKLVNESVVGNSRIIGVSAMKDPSLENPGIDEVYRIGTAVVIRMMHQLPDGIRLIVQGVTRFEIMEATQTTPYLRVKIRPIPEPEVQPGEELE